MSDGHFATRKDLDMLATAIQDTVDGATSNFSLTGLLIAAVLGLIGYALIGTRNRNVVTVILGAVALVGAALALVGMLPSEMQTYSSTIVLIVLLLCLVTLSGVGFRARGFLGILIGIAGAVAAVVIFIYLISLAPGDSFVGQVYSQLQQAVGAIVGVFSDIGNSL